MGKRLRRPTPAADTDAGLMLAVANEQPHLAVSERQPWAFGAGSPDSLIEPARWRTVRECERASDRLGKPTVRAFLGLAVHVLPDEIAAASLH